MRFVSVFLGLVAATSLAGPASARTWKQDWSVGAHPGLHVATNDAHVRIHRGEAGRMSAIVDYTVEVWGLHTRVQDPVLEFGRDGDVVTVSARSRSNAVFFGAINEHFHVDVTVPASCDVQVRSGDGGVELEPVSGIIDLQTGDGHITAHGATGTVRLWTGDGGIDADGIDGALEARTGDGHLRVAGRFDRLDLRTGDGRIDASVARGSALAQPWSVQTGDGSVILRIPRNLQALLDASTNDGRVNVNLPIPEQEGTRRHRTLRGQLNGGTMPLRIHTGDGSVTLGLSE